MSDGGRGSQKPSWKSGGGGSAPRGRSGHGWKKEKPVVKEGKHVGGRTARLIQFAVAFTACFALIVFLIYLLFPPRPALVALIGDDYAQTLSVPENVRGMNLLRSIEGLKGKETGMFLWSSRRLNVRNIADLGSDKDWKTIWKTTVADLHKPFPEKTLLVCVSLRGGVDSKKGPYFLVGEGFSEENRLPVRDVIAALTDFPKDKDIILAIDTAQSEPDWSLGILSNEFPRKLRELHTEIESIPNLWVIAASGEDQRCWPAREGTLSIFGQAMRSGLAGAAASDSGRVTLGGLFAYLKKEVERKAAESWGAVQVPILIPEGAKSHKDPNRVQINIVPKKSGSDEPEAFPDSPAAAPFRPHWDRFAAMTREIPTPGAYAPKEWRELCESIARYERLVRLRYSGKPQQLDDRVVELFKRIDSRRLIDLKLSARNTLPMAAAAGAVLSPVKPELAVGFTQLWNQADGEGLGKAWEKLVKDQSKADDPWLRTRFFDQVLAASAGQTGTEIQSLARLRSLSTELRPIPRPAEVHFASMLAANVSTAARNSPEFAPFVTKALDLRRRAERVAVAATDGAYCYSERIAPWIRSLVHDGDVRRRLGEDRLFSSDPADWRKAADDFFEARAAYDRAEAMANDLRKAMTIKDRVFAELPFLGRWAANRISVVEVRDDDLVVAQRAEKTWNDLHAVCAMLDAGPGPVDPSLSKLAQDVEDGLKFLADRHLADIGELKGGGLAADWNLEDVLDVPRVLPVDRFSLEQPKRNRTAAPSEVNLTLRNRKTLMQARLAIAELGAARIDDMLDRNAEEGIERLEAVRKSLDETIGPNLNDDPARRVQAIAKAGEQIGRRYRGLAARVDALAQGRAKMDARAARADVRLAERLERIVPGASKPTRSPAEENRRHSLVDLLVAQAQRAWEDHWYGEDPKDDPFYLAAANAYLNDAEALLKNDPRIAAAREQIKRPSALAFNEPGPVSLTSEESLSLNYTLRPDPGSAVPDGIAAAWIVPGKNLDVLPASADKEFRRSLGFKENSPPVSLRIGSPLIPKIGATTVPPATVPPSGINVRAFFRGAVIERSAPVGIYPTPEVTMYRDLPEIGGAVSVRADKSVINQFGEGNGALAIILDASGSMKPKEGQSEEDSKFGQAKRALAEVLKEIPTGTVLSIWVYGDGAYKDTLSSIQNLFPAEPWVKGNVEQFKRVTDRVAAIKPNWFTPLVHTMYLGRDDLIRTGRQAKTLLVLTDGMDQLSNDRADNFQVNEPEINPNKARIPDWLSAAFNQTGIRVNIVFFTPDPNKIDAAAKQELADAEENFKVVREFQPPGFLEFEHDPRKIVQLLLRGANQKLVYRLKRDDGSPVRTFEGDVNVVSLLPEQDFQPALKLAPGVYSVSAETDRTLTEKFVLDNGDRLLLGLGKKSKGNLGFLRALASEDYPIRRFSDPSRGNGRRLAVRQSQLNPKDGLQFLASIEETQGLETVPLRQPKPVETWIEVSDPRGKPAAVGLRWGEVFGYPAPSFALDARSWPLDSAMVPEKPTIEVWFSSRKPAPIAAALVKGRDYTDPVAETGGLAGKTVKVGDASVTIDSVVFDQTRLIIRLSHEGEPVFARLDGLSPSHQEHRFYRKAGKYTAVFRDLTPDQIRKELNGVQFISVPAFKKEAADRDEHMKIVLDPPVPNEARPPRIPLTDAP